MMFLVSVLPTLALLGCLVSTTHARPLELQPAHAPSIAPDHHRLGLPRRSVDLSSTPTAPASSAASAAARSMLLGQYVPSWETSAASSLDWDYAGLAWWFVLETTSEGFSLEDMALDDMSSFVADAHANGKSALVTVGGWSGSVYFSSLVASAESRESFATLLVRFVDTYDFDGLDIDWEYPGTTGAAGNEVSTADAANYLLFLQVLRNKLGSRLLTAAMPSGGLTGPDGHYLTDTSAYAAVLDYITVMAYDNYGSSYSATSGPNAPLATCVEGGPSDEGQIEAWLGTGFPAGQILLGVPSYSHSFKLASATLATTTYNGQSTQSFQALAATQPTDPEYTYLELISEGYLSADGTEGLGDWVRNFDSCTKTPSLFNSETKVWISYEDGQSAGLKAAFAVEKGLAGVGVYDSMGYPVGVLSKVRAALVAGTSSGSSSSSGKASVTASAGASGNWVGASIYLTQASASGDSASDTTIATSGLSPATSATPSASSTSAGTAHTLGLKVSKSQSPSAAATATATTSARVEMSQDTTSAAKTSSRSSEKSASTASYTASTSSSANVLKVQSPSSSASSDRASPSSSSKPATSAAPSSASTSAASVHTYVANVLSASSSSPSALSSTAASPTPIASTTTTVKDQSGVYTVPEGYVIVADMRTVGQGSSSSSAPAGEASASVSASLAARSWSSRTRGRRGRVAGRW